MLDYVVLESLKDYLRWRSYPSLAIVGVNLDRNRKRLRFLLGKRDGIGK